VSAWCYFCICGNVEIPLTIEAAAFTDIECCVGLSLQAEENQFLHLSVTLPSLYLPRYIFVKVCFQSYLLWFIIINLRPLSSISAYICSISFLSSVFRSHMWSGCSWLSVPYSIHVSYTSVSKMLANCTLWENVENNAEGERASFVCFAIPKYLSDVKCRMQQRKDGCM
jgi:hypothetical protein